MAINPKTVEVAPAVIRWENIPVATDAAVEPTQMRYPWKSTARTVFQLVIALLTLIPLVVTNVYESSDAIPAVVAQTLVVIGLITRIMSLDVVEEFLRQYVPFLSAAPAPEPPPELVAEPEPEPPPESYPPDPAPDPPEHTM